MTERNLVRIEGEDLRLGKTALNLDRQHSLLHLALPPSVGRQKEIAGQLHGKSGCSLHFAARCNVAIGSPHDPKEIDAGMPVKIFVFNRNQRVPQDGREIVIARDHAPLQRERSDHTPAIIVEFGDGTGPVCLQRIDLRKVGGVDQQKPSSRSYKDCNQHEQTEEHAAHQPAPADFHRWKSFVKRFHQETESE